jgi:hypothetical protein
MSGFAPPRKTTILTVTVNHANYVDDFLLAIEYHLGTTYEQDPDNPNRFIFRSAGGFSEAADVACAQNRRIVKAFKWH